MLTRWLPNSWLLLILQLATHAGLGYVIIFGQPREWLIVLVSYFFMSCLGMTMFLHRWLSHRSWTPPSWLRPFGMAAATFSAMGSPLSWAALHREHHKHTDQAQDPHSPLHLRWWFVYFFVMFVNFCGAPPRDLFRMRDLMAIHRWYYEIHLVLLALVIFNPLLGSALYLAPAALTWHSGSLVATLNHIHGYRNYPTADNSRNNLVTGFLSWGEGWHNNHHAEPSNPIFGRQWWELDIGGSLIAFLNATPHRALVTSSPEQPRD